jgi:hypothetical protein
MGKYDSHQRDPQISPRKAPVHPIWRGIGCIFMILIPILSYIIALLVLEQNAINRWFIIPADLLATGFADRLLYVKGILVAFVMFVLYALFALFTFFINKTFGPPRYGPYDMPPTSTRQRKQ